LEPWGTLTGRLLDADGKPIPRASIYAAGKGADGNTVDTVRIATVFTDDDGRFRLDGLVRGVAYDLSFREMKPKGRGGPVIKGVRLDSGEERALGELRTPAQVP
jgi:hypothetical protein